MSSVARNEWAQQRDLIKLLESELAQLRGRLGARADGGPGSRTLRLYLPEELDAALRRCTAAASRGASRRADIGFLRKLARTASERPLSLPPRLSDLARLHTKFPRFSDAVNAILASVALQDLNPARVRRMPPLIVCEPAGADMSRFASRLATCFGTQAWRLSSAAVADNPILYGSRPWKHRAGGPGWLTATVAFGNCVDPVLILENLDASSLPEGSPGLTALSALWSDEAARYKDPALPLHLDMSRVRWLATCRDVTQLPERLRAQALVVEISAADPASRRA